jgi:urease accessory protein UreE
MLHGLGADLIRVQAPFQPEGGAYGHNHSPDQDESTHHHD